MKTSWASLKAAYYRFFIDIPHHFTLYVLGFGLHPFLAHNTWTDGGGFVRPLALWGYLFHSLILSSNLIFVRIFKTLLQQQLFSMQYSNAIWIINPTLNS